MNILNLSADQLRAMTRAQIRQAITDVFTPMSKRELIVWLLETDIIQDAPVETRTPDGQPIRRVEYYRDVETGAKIKGKITTWSYYPNGDIDIIRTSDIDESDGEIGHTRIKHYQDGRQPTIDSRQDAPEKKEGILFETNNTENVLVMEDNVPTEPEQGVVQDTNLIQKLSTGVKNVVSSVRNYLNI